MQKYTDAQISQAIMTVLEITWGDKAKRHYQETYNAVYKAGILVMLNGTTNREWVGPADAITALIATLQLVVAYANGGYRINNILSESDTNAPVERQLRQAVTHHVKWLLSQHLERGKQPCIPGI